MGFAKRLGGWAAAVAVMIAAAAMAGPPAKGADTIQLGGGTFGDVTFPHHRHQDALGDCMVCHEWFPQDPGSIARLKSAGELQPRTIMNRLCLKCHRDMDRQGKTSGPISCTACHKR